MTPSCVEYVKKCLSLGLISSPCVEMGVGYEGDNNKELIRESGIEYVGTDMVGGTNVDYIVNFEEDPSVVEQKFEQRKFSTVLILSVLEHTFDPIQVLDNVFHILKPGGTCVIITPTVWPLHNYPYDCWRINPNFYEVYAKRRSLILIENTFDYVGFHSVKDNVDESGTYVLPAATSNKSQNIRSKIVHKLFDTYGRGMNFPAHVTTGVVIKKPEV